MAPGPRVVLAAHGPLHTHGILVCHALEAVSASGNERLWAYRLTHIGGI